ncbi:MAG: hypothetical protein EZS28_038241, partial [Streblomastix strix]
TATNKKQLAAVHCAISRFAKKLQMEKNSFAVLADRQYHNKLQYKSPEFLQISRESDRSLALASRIDANSIISDIFTRGTEYDSRCIVPIEQSRRLSPGKQDIYTINQLIKISSYNLSFRQQGEYAVKNILHNKNRQRSGITECIQLLVETRIPNNSFTYPKQLVDVQRQLNRIKYLLQQFSQNGLVHTGG